MIELTPDQYHAIETNGSAPIRAFDPATKAEYVILPFAVYERIRSLLSDDADWQDGAYAAAMQVFARDGWDDPRMDVYNTLDPRKAP